jgi:chromosome segregation ATPase
MEEIEITQLKMDIGELKVNVSSIKEDMSDIKHSLSSNVDDISKSLLMLTSISEKQIYNIEEHKTIHNRIDDIKIDVKNIDTCQKNLEKKLDLVDTEHKACVERRKSDIEKRKNSPYRRALDKCIEYGVVIIMALIVYSLIIQAPNFFHFMDTKPIAIIAPGTFAPVVK